MAISAAIANINESTSTKHPQQLVMRRILFRRPCFVVGIPVALAIRCFADVIPRARFHEKPGMIDLRRRLRLAMITLLSYSSILCPQYGQ